MRYRERRAQERANQTLSTASPVSRLHTIDRGELKVLDLDQLKAVINGACANLCTDVNAASILTETLPTPSDRDPTE